MANPGTETSGLGTGGATALSVAAVVAMSDGDEDLTAGADEGVAEGVVDGTVDGAGTLGRAAPRAGAGLTGTTTKGSPTAVPPPLATSAA